MLFKEKIKSCHVKIINPTYLNCSLGDKYLEKRTQEKIKNVTLWSTPGYYKKAVTVTMVQG